MTGHTSDTPKPWRLDWPTSSGARPGFGVLKSVPEDFVVDELLQSPVERTGEHLYLHLEKRGDNTDFVARKLAALSECRIFDVGYCGLKDRHAVTRQWFSVYRPGQETLDVAFLARVSDGWRVLEHHRASRKLRRGEHYGNRFVILLRNVSGDRDAIEAALQRIVGQGCPNYFGPQRFGHGGANLDQAIRLDPSQPLTQSRKSGKKRRGPRSGSGSSDAKNVLYFSAARSWLFNEVLAYRVEAGTWREVLNGEPAEDIDAELEPTGPLWGDGGTIASSTQGDFERAVVKQHPDVEKVFSQTRMKPERRPLVMRPQALEWSWETHDQLQLSFQLAPGQYATTLLSDVFEIEVSGDNRANSVIE